MHFGMQFFPDLGPDEQAADAYWAEALELVSMCDELGYTDVRTVEHYFRPYGGYSPNPLVFLSAAAMRTKRARLITGAVLPAFNHPLKLAGEIGMVDAISGGRLEVGFARAFLPHEFARFGVSLDESRARFDEGIAMVGRLLAEENVSIDGQFYSFKNVTSLPRPTQMPRPPFWVACLSTPVSFENAGRAGHSVMAIPLAGAKMAELLGLYRETYRSAGHAGNGRVMLAFHMFCAESREEAMDKARGPFNRYLAALVEAASDWTGGTSSQDYPGYDKIIAGLKKDSFESQMEKGGIWVGTPEDICDRISDYLKASGGFEHASLQVKFNNLPLEDARKSVRLFSEKVIPRFAAV